MMRSLTLAALALAAGAVCATDPLTGGDPKTGEQLAAPCAACHGPGGKSANPEWPHLAGQHGPYMLRQLMLFKSGARANPLMTPQAADLDEQQMRDLAAWFASRPAPSGVAAESAVPVAEPLHRGGDAQRGIAACSACHGPAGTGNAAAGYPRLAGQHARYLANALRRYRAIGRGEMPMPEGKGTETVQMMAATAAGLSDAEIEALASYFQGLAPRD